MRHVRRVIFLDEVNSTNDYLKRVPLEHGLCVVAESQTRGRGRRGKSWLSIRGKGLYLSILLKKPPLRNLGTLSLSLGVAVVRALNELKNIFYLKWPNDIYANGKKVAGILPEVQRDRVVAGIGVNLYHTVEELSGIDQPSTSLLIEGINVERMDLIRRLTGSLDLYIDRVFKGRFEVDEYERLCPMIGKDVVVREGNGDYTGVCLGVDSEGCLIVDTGSSVKRLFSSEVSVRVYNRASR